MKRFLFALALIVAVVLAAPNLQAKKKNPNPPTLWNIVIDPETGVGRYSHGCCDCELWHKAIVEVITVDGKTHVKMEWTVISGKTHIQRIIRFGRGYGEKPNPFEDFRAENKYEER